MLSNIKYKLSDLDHIGKNQLELWRLKNKAPVLIADTEFLVLKYGSEAKFKSCSYFINDELNKQKFNLYFLCKKISHGFMTLKRVKKTKRSII